jgi:signal transduction histidine kinase/DNA-binding response OmpR family regulator
MDVGAPADASKSRDDRDELTAALADAREQQAAASEVLALMDQSRVDLQLVFDTVVEHATKLCRAEAGHIYVREDGAYRLGVAIGGSREYRDLLAGNPLEADKSTLVGKVALERRTVHIPDVVADPDYSWEEALEAGGQRTMLGVPMLAGDEVIGVISLLRTHVDPFADRQIALVETFAKQGAIAIRNIRLLDQLQARTAELSDSVEELTELREVGSAVSSSLDLEQVLSTIVSHAVKLADADGGTIFEYDEEAHKFDLRTAIGTSEEVIEALRKADIALDETFIGRAAHEGKPAQVPDLTRHAGDPHLEVLREGGWRSVLVLPMLDRDRILGALVVRRKRPGSFPERIEALVGAFAAQSALAIQNARLFRALETKTAELEVAGRHKSDFLASMSHELRTPLNAVIGFSDVLLERMFGELTQKQEEYLHDIRGAGRHLLELLNEILDLSKIEAGRMDLQLRETPLNEQLEEALSMVRERAARKRLVLEARLDPDPISVIADELKLKQVLLNLLTNAIKYTEEGGRIDVVTRLGDTDGMAEVSVADTGIGIGAEDQARVFEAFQQGGLDSSARTEEGTGLGLTLSKRIVELHGGRIWVESELGVGSTFTFAIPGRRERAASAGAESPSPQAQASRGTVLVIEDDQSSVDLLTLYLEGAGFEVAVARDGGEGLERVHELMPVAVVLDLVLPTVDGWDVLVELKAHPDVCHLPVIIVSMLDDRGRGMALGADEYLVKPVRRHDLLAALGRSMPGDTSGGRVLVIDDDPLVVRLVKDVLEDEGYEVLTATDRAEGIATAEAERPTIILLDLLMRGIDGFAIVEELRADPATAAIPIVILTAEKLSDEEKERLNGQISYLAEKGDFDRDALVGLVRSLTRSGGGRSAWATS